MTRRTPCRNLQIGDTHEVLCRKAINRIKRSRAKNGPRLSSVAAQGTSFVASIFFLQCTACKRAAAEDSRGPAFSEVLAILLLVLLAGCATPQRGTESRPRDWEAEDVAMARAVVPPSPLFEPPLANLQSAPPKAGRSSEPVETWVALSRWCKTEG